jgi:hypothetical protein
MLRTGQAADLADSSRDLRAEDRAALVAYLPTL